MTNSAGRTPAAGSRCRHVSGHGSCCACAGSVQGGLAGARAAGACNAQVQAYGRAGTHKGALSAGRLFALVLPGAQLPDGFPARHISRPRARHPVRVWCRQLRCAAPTTATMLLSLLVACMQPACEPSPSTCLSCPASPAQAARHRRPPAGPPADTRLPGGVPLPAALQLLLLLLLLRRRRVLLLVLLLRGRARAPGVGGSAGGGSRRWGGAARRELSVAARCPLVLQNGPVKHVVPVVACGDRGVGWGGWVGGGGRERGREGEGGGVGGWEGGRE